MLDWDKIPASNRLQCVFIVETNRLICFMIFPSEVMTLSNLKVDIYRTNYLLFDAVEKGKDVGKKYTHIVSLWSHRLLLENGFKPFRPF